MKKLIRFIKAVSTVLRLGAGNIIELQRKAFCDHLTGVYNRGYFEEVAKKEIERARRYGLPFSIVVVDIDNLKMINDIFGHLAGDKVIKTTANLLERSCRISDTVVRWGGDEFLLLMPETGKNGAQQIINRIKELSQELVPPIQLSCGIASWKEGLSLEKLIKEADGRMYQEKSQF